MSESQIKGITVFNEDEDYLNRKNDFEVWKLITDSEKKKMGPAVYSTLRGCARKAFRDLKPSDIGKLNILAKIRKEFEQQMIKIVKK